ncbi:MAG: nucleotidyltransferase family protein [Acidimicrobiia bacterium]
MALGHLEDAGADLGAIAVPAGRVSGVFHSTQVWTIADAAPVSARRLLDVVARHKQLLAEPLGMLMASRVGGFVVVSGRSFQVAYPAYTRMEFDTDLMTQDLPSGAAVASALHQAGYQLGSLRIARLGQAPHAAFSSSREVGEHHVSVGVLVGGYHGHRGSIVARSRSVPWRGGTVQVPAAEDMLVMLAARAVRKRQFAFVNFNDAAVILTEEPGLDWDLVTHSARAGGLQSVLSVVLERAEEIARRPVVPPHVWRNLDQTRTDRAAHRLARAASDPSARLIATESRIGKMAVNMQRRLWTRPADVRLARAGVAPGMWSSARRRLELALYRRQLDRTTAPGASISVVDRAARWLRPRCGSLCEVVPALAATRSCLALLGGRPWSDAAGDELRRLGALLPGESTDHRCDRYRFELVA